MKAFAYNALPGRVVFGGGALEHLQREIERIGAKRALVLSTPQQRAQAEDIAGRLGERCAGLYDQAMMHVPIETARAAREEAKRLSADCAVAVGGG
jgi:maleylacetate reductase